MSTTATVLNLTDAQIRTLAAAQREASDKAHGKRGWIVPSDADAKASADKLRAWQLAMNPNHTPTPVKEATHV